MRPVVMEVIFTYTRPAMDAYRDANQWLCAGHDWIVSLG